MFDSELCSRPENYGVRLLAELLLLQIGKPSSPRGLPAKIELWARFKLDTARRAFEKRWTWPHG
jgi:hypothetical protein